MEAGSAVLAQARGAVVHVLSPPNLASSRVILHQPRLLEYLTMPMYQGAIDMITRMMSVPRDTKSPCFPQRLEA